MFLLSRRWCYSFFLGYSLALLLPPEPLASEELLLCHWGGYGLMPLQWPAVIPVFECFGFETKAECLRLICNQYFILPVHTVGSGKYMPCLVWSQPAHGTSNSFCVSFPSPGLLIGLVTLLSLAIPQCSLLHVTLYLSSVTQRF